MARTIRHNDDRPSAYAGAPDNLTDAEIQEYNDWWDNFEREQGSEDLDFDFEDEGFNCNGLCD